MINLNYSNIDLDKAKEEHYNFFACFITKKLTGNNCKTSNWDKSHPNRPNYCKGYLDKQFRYKNQKKFTKKFLITEGRLEDLILGTPEKLFKVNDLFIKRVDKLFGAGIYNAYLNTKLEKRSKFKPAKVHTFFEDLSKVVKYGILGEDRDYNSYTLANNLGVRSCVYCNRTYTVTQRKRTGKKDGRLMSPQLDHWFPQSKFPLLQISFHNLIPSCEICNSRVKSDITFDLKKHFHPYQAADVGIKFNYRYSVLLSKYQIYFSDYEDKKILETCKKMCIDQMYDAHEEELDDLITIRREYSETYLDALKKTFSEANLTDELIYRLAFGTELDKADFHKRPMSKFKHDILKELGII